jgi:hypothetical protein
MNLLETFRTQMQTAAAVPLHYASAHLSLADASDWMMATFFLLFRLFPTSPKN